jgi:exodeoxyribonuclease V beta subunit
MARNTPPRTEPRPGKKPDLWVPRFSPEEAEVVATLDALVRRSGGTISVTQVDPEIRPTTWSGRSGDEEADLAVADPRGRHLFDRTWRRWSFTGLVRTRDEDPLAPEGAAALVALPEVGGGLDEPDGDTTGGDRGVSPVATAVTAALPPMPLATAPTGAGFGTFVHAVLEHVDPTAADLDAAVGEAVDARQRVDRIDVDRDALVAGLVAALRTPLGDIAADRRLADITPADRLTEMAFDLPLRDTRARVAARAIGDVVLRTLPAADPLRGYAAALAAGRFDVDLAGYLQGSIDAVLRVPDEATGGQRFLVVDYKSNRLHDVDDGAPLLAYHPRRLVTAMEHGDYPLQALLYTVALHRYLRWRLPGYDPARHLGGIAYLFVRGMVGADTPRDTGQTFGVFAWRPPVATVLGLDHLLATGEVAA